MLVSDLCYKHYNNDYFNVDKIIFIQNDEIINTITSFRLVPFDYKYRKVKTYSYSEFYRILIVYLE